jgi:predicted restriction endonuclease
VASHRLDDFGGVEAYVQGLRQNYATHGLYAPITHEELLELDGGEHLDEAEVNQALIIDEEEAEQTPSLTEEVEQEPKQVSLTPRDAKFRILVRRAYDAKCAVCGSNLRSTRGEPEVQSAHIYPKKLKGKDHPQNGMCLCRRHHWALDAGWMSLSDDYTILVRDDLPEQEDYEFIREFAGAKITLPTDKTATPHPVFLQAHRELMGFT